MQLVEHARGRGGTVVIGAPAPIFGNGAAHAVGYIIERSAILQHAGLDGLNQGTIYIGIGRFLFVLGVELLEYGFEVLLLTRQRALNLEEVGGRQVGSIQIGHVPLHLHLSFLAVQWPYRESCGRMNHSKVLCARGYALNLVLALIAFLLVIANNAELTVGHGGIKRNRTTVHVFDVYLLVLSIGIVVLVVSFGNLVGSNEPRQLYLAWVVGVHHGCRDDRRQFGGCCRHFDGRRLEPRHVPCRAAISVAMNVPGKRQRLAQQVVGQHPLGSKVEGLTVAVAYQGEFSSIAFVHPLGASRISQRDVDETVASSFEITGQRSLAVVNVLFRLPGQDIGFLTFALYLDKEVTPVDPAVGTIGVVNRSREIDDVSTTQRY